METHLPSNGAQVDPFQLSWIWCYGAQATRYHTGSKNQDDQATSHIVLTPSPQNARKTKFIPLNLSGFLPPTLTDLFEKGFGTML
jgi:hypothetical protein